MNLFPHHFNNDSFRALPVELGIIDLLPGTEVQLSVCHRNDHFVMYDQALKVRIAVGFARAMVPVILAERGQLFEPLVDVLDETVLRIVDIDACRNMHGGHEDHALVDAAFRQRRLDLRGDVDVFAVLLRTERQIFGMEASYSAIISRNLRYRSA